MKHGAFFMWALAAATATAACGASPTDADSEPEVESSSDALSGCDGNAVRACLASNGGGGCAKHCIAQCRTSVGACMRGGGGAGCMSRCRDGDVTAPVGGGGGTCKDSARNTSFMRGIQQNPSSFTAGERTCWCNHWQKIKDANGYGNETTSRAAQLMCWGSTDGSVSLPNSDGLGSFPPGSAMAIYCQLNPSYSGCR